MEEEGARGDSVGNCGFRRKSAQGRMAIEEVRDLLPDSVFVTPV